MHRRSGRSGLLGLGVGLALADSSIVTLALPDIVRQFDVGIMQVAWVLIAYNLALAVCAVPAAHLTRARPGLLCAGGLVLFALSSLLCGLAPGFAALVTVRCVQAIGASLVVAAALPLLSVVEGSERRAAHVWTRAGVLGAALGPAAGGILTHLAGWEAIFLAQAPVALLPLLALRRLSVPGLRAVTPGRPHVGANAALLLGSAALSAALFLLVILLVNGWSLDPLAAGLIVTLMPIAAIGAARATWLGGGVVRAATGFVLIAGGLAGLGLLPDAGWGWTLAPQVLVGAGLGLTVAALTERALSGQAHQGVHGGWTIATRHAGVVLGLLALTPVFTHELAQNQEEAQRAGAALVLDSSIAPLRKIEVARDVLRIVDEAEGSLPDVRPAFGPPATDPGSDDLQRVGTALQEQLERAVTKAFGPPFLLAALFALAALAVVALARDVEP